VVAVDRRPTRHAADVDSVMVDNRAGAVAAAEHLLADGATRFACVTGPSPASTARERADGFVEALVAGGVPPGAVEVVPADFREEGGYAATLGLLRRGPGERPDALLVANNLMTLGALRAIEDAGLRVPDDVRLVGFDDAPWATLMRPRLTVVAQPTADIGRRAAELLATAGPDRPKRHDTLAPTLIVRESSHRG
jgi:LacI family transcriptional regulator